uniref:Major capsid protein n=1 Tax=Microviridae sp. ct9ZF1 TaxID=2824987 RepID=A0A8S5V815_9VIRU|nr:MAG TPA: Major capsid protein [Microviridae sp. ct9ZF1]
MAQNVFDATFDANNRIDVNSFDWSHVNNLTTNFGRITPVFCELVPAKGSLRINPEFGLELMPMVFPVQTRMVARLNFFKVTLRSMWEDYSDFISNFRDDLEEPYILPNKDSFERMLKTNTLGDYLGIPTQKTTFSNFSSSYVTRCTPSGGSSDKGFHFVKPSESWSSIFSQWNGTISSISTIFCSTTTPADDSSVFLSSSSPLDIGSFGPSALSFRMTSTSGFKKMPCRVMVFHNALKTKFYIDSEFTLSSDTKTARLSIPLGNISEKLGSVGSTAAQACSLSILIPSSSLASSTTAVTGQDLDVYSISELTEVSYDNYPFRTQRKDSVNYPKLLAYRFRAYESVYNAYYRDIRNNPFVINGRPVYNKWLPTMKGGQDTTLYELHQCNWERDFLTTAVPNPQQGTNAPLVGLTVGDVVTRADDGTLYIQKQTVLVDEDGAKYGISYRLSEDGKSLVGVDYDPVSEKTPVTAINSYAELAALAMEQGSGFTIETLRYVNAYQKFLELNMRKGFSYKQIMQGRWDIDIRFDELLMPEFIGGISRELSMRTVEQTVDQQTSTSQGQYAEALGSKTGIAGVYGNTSNNIEVFCDEESYIIGLLTVTPVPIYTQLLPKDFTYNGLLDHYQPEFDRIGYQPITYKEICPMNTDNSTSTGFLERTFGYQRPWYEYVAKYDNAHGLFRTNMKNFVMHRTFSGLPQLGQQFLLVDPDTVNQVFSVTEYTDKIFGYVKFNATARLPISRVAIPRLD